MPLFTRKRFVWNEPWFFQQRIRTFQAWLRISLFLSAIALVIGSVLFFSRGNAARPISIFEIVAMSLGVSAAVWWVLDGTNTRRQAILTSDSIIVGGDMGKYSVPTTYKIQAIQSASIVMPSQSKWPQPALYFLYDGEEAVIGIDPKVRLERLAQSLHDVGIPIHHGTWKPDQEDEFSKAFTWQADPSTVTDRATMETLPAGTISMMNVGGILKAMFHFSWAIVLWLAIVVSVIYVCYTNWGQMGIVRLGALFASALGTMWLLGQYLERIGSAASSQVLVDMARNQLFKRPDTVLNSSVESVPVEIFERSQFANRIQMIREMGFLQADTNNKRIIYEGKKERWIIPLGAIQSVSIEEVQTGTPGQSATGLLNFYVVVRFKTTEDQEFGFRHGERDYGEFDDTKRAQGAIQLFELFDSVISSTN